MGFDLREIKAVPEGVLLTVRDNTKHYEGHAGYYVRVSGAHLEELRAVLRERPPEAETPLGSLANRAYEVLDEARRLYAMADQNSHEMHAHAAALEVLTAAYHLLWMGQPGGRKSDKRLNNLEVLVLEGLTNGLRGLHCYTTIRRGS